MIYACCLSYSGKSHGHKSHDTHETKSKYIKIPHADLNTGYVKHDKGNNQLNRLF